MKYTLIILRWVDASQQDGPMEKESFIQGKEIVTSGILAEETKEWITLCLDYNPTDDEWRDIRHIPKSCILVDRRIKVSLPTRAELRKKKS